MSNIDKKAPDAEEVVPLLSSPAEASDSRLSYETAPLSANPQPQPGFIFKGPLVDVDVVPEDPPTAELDVFGESSGAKGGEEEPLLPPPEFSVYQPEYFTTGAGNVVSHDKHLNEDGEALYRFILQHASDRPSFLLNCKATHTEWRTRDVVRFVDGKNVTHTETVSETITDFDFTIDASDAILQEPDGAPVWIIGEKDAAYRGTRKLQVDSPPRVILDGNVGTADIERGPCTPKTWRRKATKAEKQASKSWWDRRRDYGYAPWVLLRGQIRGMEASVEPPEARQRMTHATRGTAEQTGAYDDSIISAPTKTLRDWADEYCASKRLLKEFKFKKTLYGWNLAMLRQAVDTVIRSNYVHQDAPHIEFVVEGDEVFVRPNNRLSRMMSKPWVMVILCITLIYPLIIWPYRTFGRHGGGKWEVAGSSFAFTKWVHREDSHPGQSVDDYLQGMPSSSSASTRLRPMPLLKATPNGISELVGEREGIWFAKWEETIGSLVRQRYISPIPLLTPLGSAKLAGIGLDGYYPDN